MDTKHILEQVRDGAVSVEEAEQYFRRAPFEELGYAKLDTHRRLRSGFAEVVFCSGKADDYLVGIFQRLAAEEGEVLGTRATPAQAALVQAACPGATYDPISRLLKLEKHNKPLHVTRVYDVGVSGLHRLLANLEPIQAANCVVAVAGMEGALASVIGGLVQNPVIAVPTSVGYGASFGGVSALLTMINSCANGIATVNIDNGYGAGYLATQINRLALGAKE